MLHQNRQLSTQFNNDVPESQSKYQFLTQFILHNQLQQLKQSQNKKLTLKYMQKQKINEALKEIFTFYSKAYNKLHSLKKPTFQQLKNEYNILSFLPFQWFCKQFNIIPNIFSVDKIKIHFKKHSNYGKFLTLPNFIHLINNLSHQKQCIQKFNPIFYKDNLEMTQEEQFQQFCHYLQLNNKQNYTKLFKDYIEDFESSEKVKTQKIAYRYRKMSESELLRKALPLKLQDMTYKLAKKKQLYVSKAYNLRAIQSKPMIVSWDICKQKSLSLSELSQKRIKRYVLQDPEDHIYLKQYVSKQIQSQKSKELTISRQNFKRQQQSKKHQQQIQKRIEQIQKIERQWNKKILRRQLNKKMHK